MFTETANYTTPLTRELAEEYATDLAWPGEREYRPGHEAWLRKEHDAGRFHGPTWAKARLGDRWYRVDGKHSSMMLANLNGEFPKHMTVNIKEFLCETEGDVVALYATRRRRRAALGRPGGGHLANRPQPRRRRRVMEASRVMQLLTNSRAKAARACLRLHQLRYELGYQSVHESAALRFGTLWHAAQEGWWSAGPGPEARLEAALALLAKAAEGGDVDPFDAVKVEELLRGYTARWGDEDYETLAVEREFRAPMLNPGTSAPSRTWEVGGKLDLIVRQGARVLIGEHKTSAEDVSPGSDYWRRLRLDGQVGTYYQGARALGFDVQGCLYDVVHKPTIRQLKATPVESRKFTKAGALYANQREVDETPAEYGARLREDILAKPEAYYQRSEVVRLDEELRDHLFDTWSLGRLIREAQVAQRWPRNPDSCVRYGRLCEFFPVCCGDESLDDTTLFIHSDNVHPELANAPADTKGTP